MKKNNCYIMSLLIGIGIGSAFGVVYGHPVIGVSIGSGMGVLIGGLIQNSSNKKDKKIIY